MEYQVVLQFPGSSRDDFDLLIEIEDELEDWVCEIADVDGHDFGSGEMNIFLFTNEPKETFDQAKKVVEQKQLLSVLRAAYRHVESEEYMPLWPKELADFRVL